MKNAFPLVFKILHVIFFTKNHHILFSQELAFHEEEKARNKQVKYSIFNSGFCAHGLCSANDKLYVCFIFLRDARIHPPGELVIYLFPKDN